MKKQTAVEWLESQFANIDENRKKVFEQAKQLEKEQIVSAYYDGDNGFHISHESKIGYAEQYFNETYN